MERPSYGKLQEPWGRPAEGRLRRALSLRQGREKSRSSDGGPERLDTPGQERLPGSLGDTEQLIQAEQEGSQRWLRQYQQVWLRAGGWRGVTREGQDPKQRDPEAPPVTREPGRAPPRHAHGDLTSLAPHESGRLWQFAHPRPLSLLQRGLAPRSKGKARAELSLPGT